MDRRLLARIDSRRTCAPEPQMLEVRSAPMCRRAPQVGLIAIMLLFAACGCAGPRWVALRDTPQNPLSERLMLMSRGGPRPSERTLAFLRRYDLEDEADGDARKLLERVQKIVEIEPTADALSAAAEISYVGGAKEQLLSKNEKALDLFSSSVAYSYRYLFDPRFERFGNPYDPQFRGACDLYNAGLESTLRTIRRQGKLRPGESFTIESKGHRWDILVAPRNVSWPSHEIDRLEFVSDYQINGLKNVYHTYGLGVPLIAVRKAQASKQPVEMHYPPELGFPVTAFLRCLPDEPSSHIATASTSSATEQPKRHRAVLELYNPLQSTDIIVDGRRIPLESDITTPLAYTLNSPAFEQLDQPTTGLLFPGEIRKLAGIYMLEPYQPGKIPVLMVHGLWSSPITWMEMFNDLRADPDIRRDYQFWFYLYPTGQPFWRTATHLRETLAKVRTTVDPQRSDAAIDQMVLVGHSMGGLVSHMQVINSGDEFWRVVSDRPIDQLKADDRTRWELNKTFYFQANPSVRRIVTIGTPHRGSRFANGFTRYMGQQLISMPSRMTARFANLRLANPGAFRDTRLLDMETSIDSLAPDCPALPLLLTAQQAPWVKFHNVVGRLPRDNWQVKLFGDGDGVVPYESAHLAGVDTEIEIAADHSNVHRHPLTILQVRDILREHVRQLQSAPQPVPLAPQQTAARLP
jgi:pimeloyl-ACP methyl ester carboxylesterase